MVLGSFILNLFLGRISSEISVTSRRLLNLVSRTVQQITLFTQQNEIRKMIILIFIFFKILLFAG